MSGQHIGLDARKPVLGGCEQQRRRPVCASAQTDQRHFYSLFGEYHIKTCYMCNFNFLASHCNWGDWAESRFVGNHEDRFCIEAWLCVSPILKCVCLYSNPVGLVAPTFVNAFYFVCVSCEKSSETVQFLRLIWDFTTRISDKFKHHMNWLIPSETVWRDVRSFEGTD